ncbi:hypothetical protein GUITHDRAFT_114016 [Guillardia theta CCMP2712]|uniref:LysM domain-containing protein n=1 Tax=Guillardia theta (strain CCMP2712) TaxID=905079 RepID=L1IV85_GUITC|nr:hypothetical protein GUITHDRAFT_114016 [Guillardia theta CCMP2712]EKX40022.1 hypothetical protein GUITHDRAFT_114016 [Guillardia theta CCMP2712]|eukprot:XP_005827002.1 hypothetical protein GUITHDRAFT_114016 [Guillardia theta CCMP2712]
MTQLAMLVLAMAMVGGAEATCCGDATREGTYVQLNGSSLLTTGAGADALYSSSFTVQLFLKLSESAVPQPVIGCMNATETRGWRVSCSSSQCCFSAYVEGSSSPALRSFCANDLSLTNWTHLTVRFTASASFIPGVTSSRRPAAASLFVDGVKRAEASWGDPGVIWRKESYVGYPALTVGGSRDWDAESRSFMVGDVDELRVWNESIPDQQILDSAFEVAACPSSSSSFNRVASITSLSNLILYLRNPQQPSQSNYNQLQGSSLSLSLSPAGSSIQVGSGGLYMHKSPVIELSPSSRGVLFSAFTPQSDTSISLAALASQQEMAYVDLLVRDPNYDDVLALTSPLKFIAHNTSSISYFSCLDRFLGFSRMEAYDAVDGPDQDGWVSFAGVSGYDALSAGGVLNAVTNSPLDSAGVASQFVHLGQNLASSGYLPPHTQTQSQIVLRVVMAHNLSADWWVPQAGYELVSSLASFSRCSGSRQDVELKLQLGVHLSPEFVDASNYNQPSRGGESLSAFSYPAMQQAQQAVAPGAHYVVGYGQSLDLRVRARDRNAGDKVCVLVSEDPGVPLGEWSSTSSGSKLTSGCHANLLFTEQVPLVAGASAFCSGACQLSSCDAGLSSFLPPPQFDRTFHYTPSVAAVGGIYRVCFQAQSKQPDGDNFPVKDPSSSYSRSLLCVVIEVVPPAPVLLTQPLIYEAVVGCKLELLLVVEDRRLNASATGMMQTDMNGAAPQPLQYVLSFSPAGSSKCFNTHCDPLPSLPQGACLPCSSPAPLNSVTLEWTPARQDALYKPYTLCLDASLVGGTWGKQQVGCVQVRVRKCQECVRGGDTLESIARSLKIGYLDLYMWNPFLERPDHLLPGMAVSTGSVYTVREGERESKQGGRALRADASVSG